MALLRRVPLARKAPLLRKAELKSKSRLKPSAGTAVPPSLKNYVKARDRGCVGPRLHFPGKCWGPLDPDHVRPSGGVGMKSPTEKWNLACLCRGHHDWKTEHPAEARPPLIAYLEMVEGPPPSGDVW